MKTMTLDELRNLPPLTPEQIFTIENAKVVPDEDCPIQTEEELKQFKPWYELHSKKIGRVAYSKGEVAGDRKSVV